MKPQERKAAQYGRLSSFFHMVTGKVRALRYRDRRMLGGRDYQTRDGKVDE